jgi:hypothetical protein
MVQACIERPETTRFASAIQLSTVTTANMNADGEPTARADLSAKDGKNHSVPKSLVPVMYMTSENVFGKAEKEGLFLSFSAVIKQPS